MDTSFIPRYEIKLKKMYKGTVLLCRLKSSTRADLMSFILNRYDK